MELSRRQFVKTAGSAAAWTVAAGTTAAGT
ncbi:MAG: twin-arginine translocation signal domain-containing protein, partial [Bacteroidota bacterium]